MTGAINFVGLRQSQPAEFFFETILLPCDKLNPSPQDRSIYYIIPVITRGMKDIFPLSFYIK